MTDCLCRERTHAGLIRRWASPVRGW